MQAYEGYFENGKFYTAGRALRIPERRRAIINILDDEIIEIKTKSQRQSEAFEKFIAANKDITDEPFDEEWDEIMSQGINIGSGVDL
jgi:hypothetical protein